MNTTSWIPTRTTSLSAEYLSTLNRLPSAPNLHARMAGSSDPQFIDQLRVQSVTDINLAKMATPPTTTQSVAETPDSVDPTILNPAKGSLAPFQDMLKSMAAGAFQMDQRRTTFDFDPQALSTDQIQENPESAKQAMEQFVGETFYGMLMKQMRNTVVQSDLFGNSSAKKMFESQLDQTLVQEMATNHSEFLSRPIRI